MPRQAAKPISSLEKSRRESAKHKLAQIAVNSKKGIPTLKDIAKEYKHKGYVMVRIDKGVMWVPGFIKTGQITSYAK